MCGIWARCGYALQGRQISGLTVTLVRSATSTRPLLSGCRFLRANSAQRADCRPPSSLTWSAAMPATEQPPLATNHRQTRAPAFRDAARESSRAANSP